MYAKSQWRREQRGRTARRPVMLTVGCALAMMLAAGVMAMLPQEPSQDAPNAATHLQPLIAIEDEFADVLAPQWVQQEPASADAAAAAPSPLLTPKPVESLPASADRQVAEEADSLPQPPAPTAEQAAAAVPSVPEKVDIDQLPRFDGRPIRPVRTLTMLVTAYSPDAASCAPFDDGITASGYSVYTNGGRLVAADTDLLPLGSIVTIPGYNEGLPVPVLDRGGAIKGNRLDVLYGTHDRALQWGVKTLEIVVWDYAD